jgi:hypothetical protein
MGMLGMLPETVSYYESLIGTYTDNIRNADTKSNIIIIVILFSISTVAGFRAQFPPYVPIYLLLLLPLCAIIVLLLAIYPRFVVIPGFPFYVRRSMRHDDFVMPPEDGKELMVLFRHRCAALANILYWKIFLFRIAMVLCLVYLVILVILALFEGFPRSGSRTPRRPARRARNARDRRRRGGSSDIGCVPRYPPG